MEWNECALKSFIRHVRRCANSQFSRCNKDKRRINSGVKLLIANNASKRVIRKMKQSQYAEM